eukprot:6913231-Prymnesium_polylepis.1
MANCRANCSRIVGELFSGQTSPDQPQSKRRPLKGRTRGDTSARRARARRGSEVPRGPEASRSTILTVILRLVSR